MEENKDLELSKEQILERSRKENKYGDERDMYRNKIVFFIGFCVAVIALLIVMTVYNFLKYNVTDLMAISLTMMASVCIGFSITAKRNKTKILLIITSIITTMSAIMYWVLWILLLIR